ncbi:MAG: hypothetical protein QOJ03_2081 [Frankiaceae bacterium]|nr:hypothetical protein [Frankiaceae bacterium]
MFVPGRRTAVGWGVAVIVAAMLAGATGCSSSGSTPRTLPPLSTTPAADATTPPANSDKAELRAATAVVREYFRLLNAPTTSLTASAMEALMTADCACKKVAVSTKEVADKGQHYFGETRITHVSPALDTATAAEVLVNYDYSRSGIADAEGRIVTSSPGRRGATLDFKLRRQGQAWLIRALVYVRPGRRL